MLSIFLPSSRAIGKEFQYITINLVSIKYKILSLYIHDAFL